MPVFQKYGDAACQGDVQRRHKRLGRSLAPVLPDVAGRIISELFTPVLLGRDPLDRGVIWNMLYGLMRDRGYYSGFMVDAISAVDCALWDIAGKHFGRAGV